MSFAPFVPPRRTLMGPGPSDVPERVLAAAARPTVGHLDPACLRLVDEIQVMLRRAFRTENGMTVVVSGPGSAGMETCLVNLIEPGDEVVVCRNGFFGGRMVEIVERCGGKAVVVDGEWGRAIDVDQVAKVLKKHAKASLLAFVHAETSTGALSDAHALAELAHAHGCLAIVDAVTSLGGVELDVDGWELDAVYSGSQKCLSCVPGLSPVTFSARAAARLRGRRTPVRSWFLDLGPLMGYWTGGGKRAYHHTVPVNALYACHEALVMLEEEGLENAWRRHRENHERLRDGLAGLGLAYVVPEGERIPQLNAVAIPDGVDDAAVRGRLLEEYGLEIGGGLGPLAGKVWRIGLMGHSARAENVRTCIGALGAVLGRR